MDEDLELNRFVKSALEAKAPFARRRAWLSASRRRGLLPWATALLAASVALVASFHVPGRAAPSSVDDVLRLLSEAENVPLAEGSPASSADLLLAWQQAPISDWEM